MTDRSTPCMFLYPTDAPYCHRYLAIEQDRCATCDDYLPDARMRTKCEVWTRVMGYHRPVSAFNNGKQSEHAERKPFVESSSYPFPAGEPSGD